MYNLQKITLSCLLSMAFVAVGAQSAFADCVDFGACNQGVVGTDGNGTVTYPGTCDPGTYFDTVEGVDPSSSPADYWELTTVAGGGYPYTGVFLYSEQGYYIEYDDTFSTSLSFDLVHFNDSDVEITVWGTRLNGTKGYLTDSSGTPLNAVTYAPSGIAEGSRYTVNIPLEIDFSTPAFQSVGWILIEPVGNEGGLIEACVN